MKTLSRELTKSEIVTDREKAWNDAIEECRGLVRKISNVQFKVAEIACDVCEIIHGGGAPHSRYNLKRFAADVQINYRTLHRWVREYRDVYCKLDNRQQEKVTRTIIKDILSKTANKDKDKLSIRAAYDDVMANRENDEDRKAFDDVRRISGIEYRVTKSWHLEEMKEDNLKAIYLFAKSISDTLESFFKNGEQSKQYKNIDSSIARVRELVREQEPLN